MNHLTRTRRQSRDDGFTLIEVVVTVVFLGLITGVVAAAVIVIFRSESGVISSTAEAHDTRQVVSYLPLDIESGPSRAEAYRAVVGGATGDRGSGCLETGNDNVLRIDVTDNRSDLIDKRIAYRVVTTSNEARIDRYECSFDGTNWVEDDVLNVADYLDPTASPVAESEIVVSNPADPVADQLVSSVTLRYVQRGDTESIVAAPREERALSSEGVCGSDPLAAAKNVAVFVETDVELHGTTVKSNLFVGGTLTFHGGTIAQASPPSPFAPLPTDVGLVAGSIDWTNSTGNLSIKPHQDVLIEDGIYYSSSTSGPITESSSSSSPSISLGASATVLTPGVDRIITPGDAFTELRACSDRLAQLPDSCNNGTCAAHVGMPSGFQGTAIDGIPRITLQSGVMNVLNLDELNLDHIQGETLMFTGCSPSASCPLIINVRSTIGGTVDFEPVKVQGSGSTSLYVMWNFPNASFVNLLPSQELRGTIMAPYSVVTSQTDIEGGIIATRFEMLGGDLNDVRYFQGSLGW